MIRFALIVASTLGFFLTAALGNFMAPLLRAFGPGQEPEAPQTSQLQPDSDPDDLPPPATPTMGGLCLMVGTLAAVGVGWTAACVAEPALLGDEGLWTTRLLIALFGALAFGAVGLADDLARLRRHAPLGLRRPVRLGLETAAAAAVQVLLAANHCLATGLVLPGLGYCELGVLAPIVWGLLLVGLAESAQGGRWSGRRGLRERVPRDAGPYGSHDHSGLVPAGGAACRIGRGADGAPALEFPACQAAARQRGQPVPGRGAGLRAVEHRLAGPECAAGPALLAGGRHGGAADSGLSGIKRPEAALWHRAAPPLAGKAGPCPHLNFLHVLCLCHAGRRTGDADGKDQLIQREECRWRPSAEKKAEPFSILQRDPGPWPTLLINWMATLGIIVIFGLVMLFSASYTTGYLRFGDSLHFIRSQVLCLGLGVVAMALFSYIDYRFLRKLVWPGYLLCLVLLVLVLFSTPLNGCRRWISFGGFTVQVSEIAKFEMILLTAHLAAKAPRLEKLDPGSNRRVPPSVWLYQRLVRELIVPLLPLLLVLALLVLEPHMSGIVLTTAIVGTILLLGGNGGIITWAGAATGIFLLETLLQHIDSIPYLQSRLDGWTQDLSQMTDQTLQSLYAIGSGGVTGLGLGNSIEKQLWLPESNNDFIFSVVCEELGFVGAVLVILLFVLFLVEGFWLAFHAENRYCTLVGIGIMAQIAWQVFCNIAVVTNTLPNTGISLPFFSSGGTSLILLLAEMGVMVNIGRNGERARLERENLHTLREEQRKAKTIVLNTARNAQPER